MNDMDFEDFLITIYRPLKAIEVLTDIAYEKGYCDWGLLSGNIERENADKLISILYAINLCTEEVMKIRQQSLNNIKNFEYSNN